MFDLKYDYDSLMHYTTHAFAIDESKPVITPLKPLRKAKLGQRERMSKNDIKRINKMYCDNRNGALKAPLKRSGNKNAKKCKKESKLEEKNGMIHKVIGDRRMGDGGF